MTHYYGLLIIFAILAYIIVVDSNVSQYIVLLWKMLGVQFNRFIFILKFKPRLVWDTWNLKRTIKIKKKDWDNVADEELVQELDTKNENH